MGSVDDCLGSVEHGGSGRGHQCAPAVTGQQHVVSTASAEQPPFVRSQPRARGVRLTGAVAELQATETLATGPAPTARAPGGRSIVVKDVMTVPPLSISPTASLRQAAGLLASSEASDLMVADGSGALVGVLSEGDLIRAVLPNLAEILAAGGSVGDAMKAFVRKGFRLADRSIRPYVITAPIVVAPTDHVGVVAAALIERQIRRLPVTEGRQLVGTVSRSDLVRAIFGGTG